MARRRHKKKNYKGQKAQLLKGKIREASEILIRSQQADERIFIPETVELFDCGRTVDRAKKKRDNAEVPAVIKQWQKRWGQPTERPDAEDDVKKQGGKKCDGGFCGGTESSVRIPLFRGLASSGDPPAK